MKTKEELKALKEEVKNLNKKIVELTDEELDQVSGSGVKTILHDIEIIGTSVTPVLQTKESALPLEGLAAKPGSGSVIKLR